MSRLGIFAWCGSIGLFATGVVGHPGLLAAATVDTTSYGGLEGRSIGPLRG